MSEPSTPPPAAPAASAPPESRPLRRSRRDRVFGGVCGGLGPYLDVDPVLLRVAAVALALSGGVGVLAYVAAWVLIPESGPDEPAPGPWPHSRRYAVVAGTALVALGVLMLLRELVPGLGHVVLWPLVVIGAGLLVVFSARG